MTGTSDLPRGLVDAVLARYGGVAVGRLVIVLALFLLAHSVRTGLLFGARVLHAAMCRADTYVTTHTLTAGQGASDAAR
ncbi:hypothetical protein Ga0074812_15725 [Parafrankia irregularis]|uniref:Uncharacterized protein n=1 Tax=Parafrankia irregularis TaxID=795642 RepID=A0A0S4R140_9ACTN|nr:MULTISPECIES: hypothetical protein [Parafrankia]MBE3206822.1 hypothetical protein [Parafrankia sp. CH37]CUU61135.1 hypothetical protein Ga0074812_15725 [Parafrankia irregularis]